MVADLLSAIRANGAKEVAKRRHLHNASEEISVGTMTEGGEATARFLNYGAVGKERGVETDIVAGCAPISAD